MRFIVTKEPQGRNKDVVEVRLHPDTKKAIAWHGTMAAIGVVSIIYLKKNW